MKIVFVVPYPRAKAPSQRFRFEQQLEQFNKKEIDFDFFPFFSSNAFDILYHKGKYLTKVFYVVLSYFKRFGLLFKLKKYDYVFIHREASPIGPPIFEWLIAKLLKKKIIYDFDDAIWLANTSSVNQIISKIKWHSKVASICKWAYKVSCGNTFLAQYAKQYNKNVHIIPTTVDLELVHNKTKEQITKMPITIGWTGTHSTINYLYDIEDVLYEIQKKNAFNFLVISNKDPNFKKLAYEYVDWNKEREIDDLLRLDIGIMPLQDNKWAKGKCGFKAIQYMALGIPPIVSAVGVNDTIVDHKKNGMVCNNAGEWKNTIMALLENEVLRVELGKKAQEKIRTHYSKKSQEKNYLSLFDFS